MRAYLLIVVCLGARVELPTLAAHSFDAWLTASTLYPQADRIVVRPAPKAQVPHG